MKIFGLTISRHSAPVAEKDYSFVPYTGVGWWGYIKEAFTGAWQRNIKPETRANILAFSAVYACIALIAEDIAKLKLCLVERNPDTGVWAEVERTSPYWNILLRPNQFQTSYQFVMQYMVTKLMYGNTYVLLEREQLRGIPRAMYVLDPRGVTPKIADDGSVWYDVGGEKLAGFSEQRTFPDSEIIHDRAVTLFHPLVGVSPIYACGSSATQGIRIQANSERFFRNNSAPSGHLTAPGRISQPTAERLKEEFEKNFRGENYGRLLVTGDNLKYEPFTIPANDAQLIEQLRWTVEDVARCFKVPLHKLAVTGGTPSFNNISAFNQDYHNQALQSHIVSMEQLLADGIGLNNVRNREYAIEVDLDDLLRMDPVSRMEVSAKGVGAGILMPNEGRMRENLEPVEGGDTPYLQEQNWALAELAKRKMPTSEPAPAAPAAPLPAPSKSFEDFIRVFRERVREEVVALEQ